MKDQYTMDFEILLMSFSMAIQQGNKTSAARYREELHSIFDIQLDIAIKEINVIK